MSPAAAAEDLVSQLSASHLVIGGVFFVIAHACLLASLTPNEDVRGRHRDGGATK